MNTFQCTTFSDFNERLDPFTGGQWMGSHSIDTQPYNWNWAACFLQNVVAHCHARVTATRMRVRQPKMVPTIDFDVKQYIVSS